MDKPAGDADRPVTAGIWLGFGAMCAGMFMAILDVQIVATALPTIQDALGIAPDQMSWVQTAYLIAEVVAIPLTGLFLRVLGMRWLFVISTTVFLVASIGCAFSGRFGDLVAWRVLQGFSGGTLIPAVFAAVFLLFPERRQGLATTVAGVMAVSAPTAGPIAGGWLTDTFSWHWLFLINVPAGVAAILIALRCLPRGTLKLREARALDWPSLVLMAIGLAALLIALKQAPERGWTSGLVAGLLVLSLLSGAGFVRRTLRAPAPVVDLRTFADRRFAIGCVLSFILGIGLFGSVYLMPVFLAFVRGQAALEIGTVMLVTGVAQLLIAPVAVALEQRANARLLTAAGFGLFSLGLGLSAFQTPETGFAEMVLPQVVRGLAIMFCLLPPTRLALGHLDAGRVPDASGVFNLMRNLGGAIGLALIDTVIYTRAPQHAEAIVARLEAGDAATAQAVGIPSALFANRPPGPVSAATLDLLRPLVEKAALTQAINDAWAMLAALSLLAVLCVPFARPERARGRPGSR